VVEVRLDIPDTPPTAVTAAARDPGERLETGQKKGTAFAVPIHQPASRPFPGSCLPLDPHAHPRRPCRSPQSLVVHHGSRRMPPPKPGRSEGSKGRSGLAQPPPNCTRTPIRGRRRSLLGFRCSPTMNEVSACLPAGQSYARIIFMMRFHHFGGRNACGRAWREDQMSRSRRATTTASTRLWTSSLLKMCCVWFRTVGRLMERALAMSSVPAPVTMSRRTSSSRLVRAR
jgi:hypothetical protein